jgi:hypothetical protein
LGGGLALWPMSSANPANSSEGCFRNLREIRCFAGLEVVSKTKWMFGLESFLREHYTSSRESAAILAAYLKGQDKALSAESQLGRVARHTSQAKSSETRGQNRSAPPLNIGEGGKAELELL